MKRLLFLIRKVNLESDALLEMIIFLSSSRVPRLITNVANLFWHASQNIQL